MRDSSTIPTTFSSRTDPEENLRVSEFKSVFCLTETSWLMTGAERLAIVGLLELLRPQTILEFGTGWGGATCYFDRYASSVITVDVETRCPELLSTLHNTRFLRMTTQEAASRLRAEHRHFDLALVDADHAEDIVYQDVLDAMELSDLVLCHDSFNPQCRRGIKRAVNTRNVYSDLDFVPGKLQNDGLWGGLGLIIPGLTRDEKYVRDPQISPYPYLAAMHNARDSISNARGYITNARRRAFSPRILLSKLFRSSD